MRVLVADDDETVRLLLQELLIEMGCEVVLAADGQEALVRCCWDLIHR